jgi:uncharacterized membrane protein
MQLVHDGIEASATLIEVLAVAIMLVSILVGTAKWLLQSGRQLEKTYERYRVALGKAMLVGLEILVAADIIRTVALESTLTNIATLAALVVVRTFLGWSLSVEVEGRWPWQKPGGRDPPQLPGLRQARGQPGRGD